MVPRSWVSTGCSSRLLPVCPDLVSHERSSDHGREDERGEVVRCISALDEARSIVHDDRLGRHGSKGRGREQRRLTDSALGGEERCCSRTQQHTQASATHSMVPPLAPPAASGAFPLATAGSLQPLLTGRKVSPRDGLSWQPTHTRQCSLTRQQARRTQERRAGS